MKYNSIFNSIVHLLYMVIYAISCFTMASDKLGGYFGAINTKFILLKFLIVFLSVMIVTSLELKVSRNFDLVKNWSAVIILVSLLSFIFDYFVTKISGTIFLYRSLWAGYMLCADFSLLITCSLFAKVGKTFGYSSFFKTFINSFSLLFAFIFILVFARTPFSNDVRTYNFVPFSGTFKMLLAMADNLRGGFEPPLLFFGNIIFFVPFGIIVPYYLKKLKPYWHIIVGFVTPIIIECYQYIFCCGDADVDDLILNIGGFLIGYIYFLTIKKLVFLRSGRKNDR